MKMFVTPTWHINSIYRLSPQDLLNHGIKGVIVDLDNTLLAWNEHDHTPQLRSWAQDLASNGIKLYILSNNHTNRVARVAKPLDIPYQGRAYKPLSRNFKQAMKKLDLPKENIAVIGDQVMTDVIGANRLGLKVILVKPLVDNDNIYTGLNRFLEKIALASIGIDRHEDWGDQLD